MDRPTTRRSVLAVIGSGVVMSVASSAVSAQDDSAGDQWPDDCDDLGEQDILPVDGTQYDGTLTPNSRDAIRLNLAEGEFAVVAARFEMYNEFKLQHGRDVSLTSITGEPASNLENINSGTTSDWITEPGTYELRLYAETDQPCIELLTDDEAAGAWAMAFERSDESPPPVDAPETIGERVSDLEERVERLEEQLAGNN